MMEKDDGIEDMDTSDTPWWWHYLADCGKWHRVEDDPSGSFRSTDFEAYYQINPRVVITIASHNVHSMIDFPAMLHTDYKRGLQRRIRRGNYIERSCSCFNTCPVFWERVDLTCPYQLIPLDAHTNEYQTVAAYVRDEGLFSKSIVSIIRIQNLDLWEMFCRKKEHLKRIHGVQEIEERRLFHGTKFENIDNICKCNFDLRLTGQNGHTYGKGIYFAKHAMFADKYSMESENPLPLYGGETRGVPGEKTKVIFLARVVIGRSTVGQAHYQKPDHGSPDNHHYSCVDRIPNPTICVVFDPNQIYPEYLIQYTR